PLVAQVYAGEPAREGAVAVGRGVAVAHEQEGGHGGTVRVLVAAAGATWWGIPVIVDQAIYRPRHREPCGDLGDALDAIAAADDRNAFLWIGLKDPSQAEFALVNQELGLPPLAVEDAVKGHQRAKVELFDDTIFVVLKTLRY